MKTPMVDTARARRELGWAPRYTALEVIQELLDGLRKGAGLDTPPLSPLWACDQVAVQRWNSAHVSAQCPTPQAVVSIGPG